MPLSISRSPRHLLVVLGMGRVRRIDLEHERDVLLAVLANTLVVVVERVPVFGTRPRRAIRSPSRSPGVLVQSIDSLPTVRLNNLTPSPARRTFREAWRNIGPWSGGPRRHSVLCCEVVSATRRSVRSARCRSGRTRPTIYHHRKF